MNTNKIYDLNWLISSHDWWKKHTRASQHNWWRAPTAHST